MTVKSRTTCLLRLGVLLLCFIAPQLAAAQTPNFFNGTEFGGLVDGNFQWNTNTTAPMFRAFDIKHDSFDLSMAELWLAKTPAMDSPIGYKVRLNFGSAPEIMAEASGQFRLESPYKNLEEAYGSYLAPVGKGLQIDFGKFAKAAGAEVIEAKDNWNYSRSLLFQLATPLYHAGVRMTYSPNDKVTLMGGVVNGWNDVSDNNKGKTIIASVAIKPSGAVSIIENYIAGPEQAFNTADWRALSETVVRYTATPMLSLMANYDYGRDTVGIVVNTWQGIAAYARIQATKAFAVVPRVEYYNDANAWSTATVQHLTDGTLTLEVKAAENFLWRIEYRGDFSNKSPFVNDTGAAKKNQQTIAVGMLYSFSSKL